MAEERTVLLDVRVFFQSTEVPRFLNSDDDRRVLFNFLSLNRAFMTMATILKWVIPLFKHFGKEWPLSLQLDLSW